MKFLFLLLFFIFQSLHAAAKTNAQTNVQIIDVTYRDIDFNFGWSFLLATRTPVIEWGGATGAHWADNGLADPPDMPANAEVIDIGFDDSHWRRLDVPHDWSIEGARVPGAGSQAFTQGGLGWYRKRFYVPETFDDEAGNMLSTRDNKRFIIEFEGIYKNSTVWINGEKLGVYPSGYTAFAYDITEHIRYSEQNVIVVRVEHRVPSGRWYSGSGITRPVKLIVTNQASFNRHGILIRTPELERTYTANGLAQLLVSADAFNYNLVNGISNLRVSVLDRNGIVVASGRTNNNDNDSNPTTPISFKDVAITVPNVNLWWSWDKGDPYLYTVRVELLYQTLVEETESVIDAVDIRYGFRWLHACPNSGFFLNGQHVDLRGNNLHSSLGALGAATNSDALERNFRILMGMGINSHRSAHYPHSNQTIEICSKLGILVVDENFDGWGGPKAAFDMGNWFHRPVPHDFAGLGVSKLPDHWTPMPADARLTWSEWVTREMILRGRNEPSIIMWSIGNEVRQHGIRPAWYDWRNSWRGIDNGFFTDEQVAANPALNYKNIALDQWKGVDKPTSGATTHNAWTEALRLRNIVHDLDPTRYIVYGGDHVRTPPAANSTAEWANVMRALDGFGFNYNTAHSLDVLLATFSQQGRRGTFFFEAESSSATSTRGKYQSPRLPWTPPDQTPGNRGVSSFDNNLASWTMPHEYGLKKNRDRNFFAGMFIWGGIDYLGEPTPYGVFPAGVSNFGAIDLAGFPKSSYYAYRAVWNCWTKDPFAYIAPNNWTDFQNGELVDVWVYTNAGDARLYLNGKCLGPPQARFERKKTNWGHYYWETDEPTFDASGPVATHDGLFRPETNPFGYTSPNGKVPASLPHGVDGDKYGFAFATDGGTHGKIHLTWVVPFEPGELKVVAYNPVRENACADDLAQLPQGTTYEQAVQRAEMTTYALRTAGIPHTVNMSPDREYLLPDGRSLMFVEVDIVDQKGERVPSAKNLLKFDVAGPAAIFGVENGATESAETTKWWDNYWDTSIENQANAREKNNHSRRSAWMGKVLVVLIGEKNGQGNITLTVSSEGMVPATLTVRTTATGAAPTVTFAELNPTGATVSAPRTITILRGEPVILPVDVNVTFAGGIIIPKKVTWNNIPAASFATVDEFVVDGTFDELSLSALNPTIKVNVIPMLEKRENIALNSELKGEIEGASSAGIPRNNWYEHVSSITGKVLTTGAIATATHTTGNYFPNHIIDGSDEDSFWDNRSQWMNSAVIGNTTGAPLATSARASDIVEVVWKNERTFNRVSINFLIPDANYIIPKELMVQYWDGFEWINAKNQRVMRDTARNETISIQFDYVAASRVRVFMKAFDMSEFPYPAINPIVGSFRISAFEVTWGNE